MSRTNSGIWIVNGFILSCNANEISNLDVNISRCLNSSQDDVQHPKSFADIFKPVLEAYGVKSFKTFMQNSKCVEIERMGNTISFIATRNEGHKNGFVTIDNLKNTITIGQYSLGETAMACLKSSL
ncbi:hypothetical protein [Sphingobium sp. WCS2017Hpa-17]|uniref:hypothetical protein n=1 Tax=Sphingobium sp. WCS2017Hpa-17 TaxID=3073638 RepID=UPI00288B37E8|nr:hypothetical protein [Sphingobium sp. WCS2017Hpa-17]